MSMQIVETYILKNWIKQQRFGLERLVVEAQVSATIIRQATKGVVPESWARKQIADAIGVDEKVLFPHLLANQQAA